MVPGNAVQFCLQKLHPLLEMDVDMVPSKCETNEIDGISKRNSQVFIKETTNNPSRHEGQHEWKHKLFISGAF